MESSDFAKLRAPFAPDKISWRVGSTTGEVPNKKGMALAYIDARDVMERLDEVAGALWQAEYTSMHNGTCCCRIGIKVGEEWIWRANGALNLTDSDKADAKEMAEKGSYSDSFKRAAVLFGIGRYLYDLDSQWVALEPAGRSFKIAAGEYAKLRALLSKAGSEPLPAPIPDKPKQTAAQWADDASKAISDFTTIVGLDAWGKRNMAALTKLANTDSALWNTLLTKIDIRRRELT